jgi:hypothetical protein
VARFPAPIPSDHGLPRAPQPIESPDSWSPRSARSLPSPSRCVGEYLLPRYRQGRPPSSFQPKGSPPSPSPSPLKISLYSQSPNPLRPRSAVRSLLSSSSRSTSPLCLSRSRVAARSLRSSPSRPTSLRCSPKEIFPRRQGVPGGPMSGRLSARLDRPIPSSLRLLVVQRAQGSDNPFTFYRGTNLAG